MDFVYITDVARANVLAAEAPCTDGCTTWPRRRDEPARTGRRRCCGSWERPAARVRSGADGEPGAPTPGRHRAAADGPRLQRRGRTSRRAAATGPVVAAERARAGSRMTADRRRRQSTRTGDRSRSCARGSATRRPTAVAAAVASGWVAQGPRVAAFEEAFAATVGAAHGVAVSSCTTGAAPGPRRSPASARATRSSCRRCRSSPRERRALRRRHAGLRRRRPDDAATSPPRPSRRCMTDRTTGGDRGHQAGVPADVDAIRAAVRPARRRGRRGRRLRHRRPPTTARRSAGALARRLLVPPAQDPHHRRGRHDHHRRRRLGRRACAAARARHERRAPPTGTPAAALVIEEYVETGFNYRMTDIQAAIGLVQLGRLDAIVARRRELARALPASARPTSPV